MAEVDGVVFSGSLGGKRACLVKTLTEISRAYSSVIFLKSTVSGVFVLLLTFVIPNIGISGLLSVLVAALVCQILNLARHRDGLHLLNSLLVGLAVGAFFRLNIPAVVLLILGSVSAAFVGAIVSNRFWRVDRLPALSLAFVLVTFTILFASQSFDRLSYFLPQVTQNEGIFSLPVKQFLESMGAIFFIPEQVVGMLLLLIIFYQSRYLGFLAVSGYLAGTIGLGFLVGTIESNFLAWSGFNFALSAMAVGGILTVPAISSYVLALVSAFIAALIASALDVILVNYSFPVLAAPFVLATLTVVAALKIRIPNLSPTVVSIPDLPEVNYERARLANFRNGSIESIPLLAPFNGEWAVYQGFNGPHTHKEQWRYALDFYIEKNEQSFDGKGSSLDDFYCFGLPVLAPVHGTVIRCFDELNDNLPGEMDTKNNWGNFVLIQLDSGRVCMLAHLRQHSIKVKEKQRVEPGDQLAACGNSGRSPQPHLHIQVQITPELNSPTIPFHLASVLQTSDTDTSYKVVCVPETEDRIEMAQADSTVAQGLHFPIGRQLQFLWQDSESEEEVRTLTVDVDLEGQYRVRSNSGANAAFTEMNGVLAFYDRCGPDDRFFDAWLLSMGLTPLSDKAQKWIDSPSITLFPLTLLQKLWVSIRFPLGAGLESSYRRYWDEHEACWVQTSSHVLPVYKSDIFYCQASISQQLGCIEFRIETDQKESTARLHTVGLKHDEGIPGWTEVIHADQNR